MKETIEMGLFKDYPDVLSVKEVCQALRIGNLQLQDWKSLQDSKGFIDYLC